MRWTRWIRTVGGGHYEELDSHQTWIVPTEEIEESLAKSPKASIKSVIRNFSLLAGESDHYSTVMNYGARSTHLHGDVDTPEVLNELARLRVLWRMPPQLQPR